MLQTNANLNQENGKRKYAERCKKFTPNVNVCQEKLVKAMDSQEKKIKALISIMKLNHTLKGNWILETLGKRKYTQQSYKVTE